MKNTTTCKRIDKSTLFAKQKGIVVMSQSESEKGDSIKYPNKISKNTIKVKK